MRYFRWINKYHQGDLSPEDQLAFEHELKENADLRAEFEAFSLTEILLKEAVNPTSTYEGSFSSTNRFNFNRFHPIAMGLAAIVLVLLFCLLFFQTPNDNHNLNPNSGPQKLEFPADLKMEKPEPSVDTAPVASNSKFKINESTKKKTKTVLQKAPLPNSAPSIPVIISPSSTSNLGSRSSNIGQEQNNETRTTSIKKKIAIYTVRAVMDSTLTETSDMALTATETIVLKAGFHAKAGTSFIARINKGPLFDEKSLPN